MASTVYRTNKKTGTVYAYSCESFRDPVTKKSKNRRTYLGRVDPVTQLIIPKGEPGTRNRSRLGENLKEGAVTPELSDVVLMQREEIENLKNEIKILRFKMDSMQKKLGKIKHIMDEMVDSEIIDA